MEITTFLPIAIGKFSLLSYWLLAGIWAFPSGFPIPFRNFPEAAQKPLGISQRYSIPFSQYSAAVQQPLRAFPSGYWLKRGNFHPFSLKGRVSVNIL
jgi:hypothetical protein